MGVQRAFRISWVMKQARAIEAGRVRKPFSQMRKNERPISM